MNLDKKDFRILEILDWEARTPITQIAKKCKLNKDVVRYRIANLEKNGIIEGYYTIINTPKLGYLTVRLYFDFMDLNKSIELKIIDYLSNKFDASQVFSIEGEYQMGVILWEKSLYNLDKKIKKFKELFGDYVNKEHFSIFIEFSQYPKRIFLNNNYDKFIQLKEENKFELKKNDFKILSELSKNARITSTELSIKLKIPQTTIITKIKYLEKNKIILGYRAKIISEKLGYENYFLEIFTHKGKDINGIKEYSKICKNCIYADLVFPGADIELETEFKSKKELLQFLSELKNKFKSIKKIKYWTTIKYHKLTYFP